MYISKILFIITYELELKFLLQLSCTFYFECGNDII